MKLSEITNGIIVACPGPSLFSVDLKKPNLPIAAVSTAIRCIPEPDFWIFVDRIKPIHGDEAPRALVNPNVVKVVPSGRKALFKNSPNMIFQERSGLIGDRKNRLTRVIRTNGQSLELAVQWLIICGGFDQLIFAGCDLNVTKLKPYAHAGKPCDREYRAQLNNFRKLKKQLQEFASIAEETGRKLLSWTPDPSPLNEFMERFEC